MPAPRGGQVDDPSPVRLVASADTRSPTRSRAQSSRVPRSSGWGDPAAVAARTRWRGASRKPIVQRERPPRSRRASTFRGSRLRCRKPARCRRSTSERALAAKVWASRGSESCGSSWSKLWPGHARDTRTARTSWPQRRFSAAYAGSGASNPCDRNHANACASRRTREGASAVVRSQPRTRSRVVG